MLTYHIDASRRVMTTRVAGRLTAGELAGFLQHVVRDPKFDATFNSLIIAMDADSVPAAPTAAALAPMVRHWSTRRSGARWAFVLPSEEARATAEIALNEVRLTAVVTRCFLSEGAASAWLEAAGAPPHVPPVVV